jgi:hypothetical protein
MVRYVRIPEQTADTATLCEFVRFLPTAIRIAPGRWRRFCELARRFLEESVEVPASQQWQYMQKWSMDAFERILAIVVKRPNLHVGLLSVGFHDAIFRHFAMFPEYNKVKAAKIIARCYRMDVPHCDQLGRPLASVFDPAVFLEAVKSDDRALKTSVLDMFGVLFEYDGDQIGSAMDLGLAEMLVELVDKEQFDVKAAILDVVRKVVAFAHRDCDREPFVTDVFLDLLSEMLEDRAAQNLHDAALSIALALARTMRPTSEWYGAVRELIGEEGFAYADD